MNYGFITSLPRSGSAWIANYLSYGDCAFMHDAWKHHTPEQLREDLASYKNLKAAGVADSGSLFILDQIDQDFPDAKWVLITRPIEDVKASCQKLDFPLTDFTTHLARLCNSREVLKVPFKEMFDRADEIGRWIYPKWKCPVWRKEELKRLNVQLHWGRVSDQFKVPAIIKDIDTITPSKMEYYRLVREICNNDTYAVRFLAQAREASELYRRLKEGKAIDLLSATATLEAMATEWIISPFVRNFSASLAPALMAAIEKYHNQKDLEHCPIDIDLLTTVTYLYRGNDGVKEFMPKVRELSDRILKEKP
jgi:hypothetical protein